jgi:hypothetical protein
MKKPKIRKPRAKPTKMHISKKKKNIGDVALLKCFKCKGEFFMVININKEELCLGCLNVK